MEEPQEIQLAVKGVSSQPGHQPWQVRWIMSGIDQEGRHVRGSVPTGASVKPGDVVAFRARLRVKRLTACSQWEFVNPRGFHHVKT